MCTQANMCQSLRVAEAAEDSQAALLCLMESRSAPGLLAGLRQTVKADIQMEYLKD